MTIRDLPKHWNGPLWVRQSRSHPWKTVLLLTNEAVVMFDDLLTFLPRRQYELQNLQSEVIYIDEPKGSI